ncbi:helix-turn-helix domain-containing protein [Larkinella terrae]
MFHIARLEEHVPQLNHSHKPHAHPFYSVTWVQEGSGIHVNNGKAYEVAPNQLFFLAPGKMHSWQLSADTKGYNLFFDSDFCRGTSGHLLYRYPFFHANKEHPLLQVTDPDALFADIFDFIFSEYQSKQANRFEVILSALHIVLELSDRLYHEQWNGNGTYLYDRIRQYEQLIEHQFLTVRMVSDYAAQMNVTPHYLNQLCKKVVGKTASQLYHERIVLEARFLLAYTSDSVKEIGFRLGFQDPSYFVRFFRKNTGETPADFRQRKNHQR